MKLLIRIAAAILLFLTLFWFVGTSFPEFKEKIGLKSPLEVFHINLPEMPDDPSKHMLEKPTENKVATAEKPEETEPETKAEPQTEVETSTTKPEEVPTEATTAPKEDKKQTKVITKDGLNKFISQIKVSKETQKQGYVRDDFEKPTKSFKLNGEKLTRNKYAWHISKYLKSESPFEYTCPYTELSITDMSKLDFEHIVPLSYVYKYGDVNWSNSQMNTYAYDMLIGMDVFNSANRSHGDKGPSEWLPSSNIGSYCLTWLTICKEYGIAMRKTDIDVCRLEILNAVSSGEDIKLLNQFKKNTTEYTLQQDWVKDLEILYS